MTPVDGLSLLVETIAASSMAVLMVMAIRGPLRSSFGATVAYSAWLLVPAALVAVLLPAATAVPGSTSVSNRAAPGCSRPARRLACPPRWVCGARASCCRRISMSATARSSG